STRGSTRALSSFHQRRSAVSPKVSSWPDSILFQHKSNRAGWVRACTNYSFLVFQHLAARELSDARTLIRRPPGVVLGPGQAGFPSTSYRYRTIRFAYIGGAAW